MTFVSIYILPFLLHTDLSTSDRVAENNLLKLCYDCFVFALYNKHRLCASFGVHLADSIWSLCRRGKFEF